MEKRTDIGFIFLYDNSSFFNELILYDDFSSIQIIDTKWTTGLRRGIKSIEDEEDIRGLWRQLFHKMILIIIKCT